MAKKSILVVDDSPIMRVIIGSIVQENSQWLIADYAGDGQEALGKLDTIKPDLILLDLEMKPMDGVDFLKQVKLKSNAPILIITGLEPDSDKVSQVKGMGYNNVIMKPTGPVSPDLKKERGEQIQRKIEQLIGT